MGKTTTPGDRSGPNPGSNSGSGGPREPQVRQKSNGAFVVEWGHKEHYLGMDRAKAHDAWWNPASPHPGSRANWLTWKAQRAAALSALAPSTGRTAIRRERGALTVSQLIDLFLASYDSPPRPQARVYFTHHLKRWRQVFGPQLVVVITTARPQDHIYQPPVFRLLQAMRTDMAAAGLSNKTINHDSTAVKRLFNFAAEQGLAPAVSWKGLKRLPTRRSDPEDLTPVQLFEVMRRLHAEEPRLLPYAALNYLTVARPSEVVQLIRDVHGDRPVIRTDGRKYRTRPVPPAFKGRFLPVRDQHGSIVPGAERGLYVLRQHKNAWREHGGSGGRADSDLVDSGSAAPDRYLVLTPQAHVWLAAADASWSTLDSYSRAFCRAVPGVGPRQLRDSAASHLRLLGSPLEDVQAALGHAARGEWPSYARTPWPRIYRSLASGLSL